MPSAHWVPQRQHDLAIRHQRTGDPPSRVAAAHSGTHARAAPAGPPAPQRRCADRTPPSGHADVSDAAPDVPTRSSPSGRGRRPGTPTTARTRCTVAEATPHEAPPHAGDDLGQDIGDVGGGRRRGPAKTEAPVTGPREHTVQDERVQVHVEIERPTKPLRDHHGAAAIHAARVRASARSAAHHAGSGSRGCSKNTPCGLMFRFG